MTKYPKPLNQPQSIGFKKLELWTDNPRIAGWIYKENENSQSQVTSAEILKFLTDEEGKNSPN